MAGKAIAGDVFSSNLAGLSKNELYDIMKQMKTLIEQNQQQARQILVQNPTLTRALFQAQIMLGMVQPPQVMPNIIPAESLPPQPLVQPPTRPSTQAGQPSMPTKASLHDTNVSQAQNPLRKQYQNQSAVPTSSSTGPTTNLHHMPMSSHAPHLPKEHVNVQASQMSLPQSSHVVDTPPVPHYSVPQPPLSLHQPQMPNNPTQLQQPLQMPPSLPPLPQRPRPQSMPNFHHQLTPQMGPNMGFQHSGPPPPQMNHSQPMFHPGAKHPQINGPPFQQGQSAHISQLPPQSNYQGGSSHMVKEYGNSGGPSWMPPGPMENAAGSHLPGPPPPLVPNPLGPGNQQPPRPPPISPEMEKALVQQVMNLTQEQINLLPPEQRQQVLQLQQLLR